MTAPLHIADGEFVHAVTMDDLARYHGRDFFNGLAQAFVVVREATLRLGGGQPLDRRRIRLVLGLDPPGVVDGFEYLTRAFSDRRVVIDRRIGIGPESFDGHYYFELQYGGRRLVFVLRDDIVPEGYSQMARRGFARLLDGEEMRRWSAGKRDIADRILARPAEESFHIEGPSPA
ncbi:hypothetical protein EDC65_0965 [Stella humosa]|uniref:Uncharacterized protein n=1 Tax=Stella humosa TaxID=94 RepID=A0A3N1ME00_9PROT|nr:hypothetical protein [Stella humosa]ROQ01778.1 hypothetical protein EDC65_0965 [Stella humosa]BBK32163.1 hypothetical protein STHU_27970 [Stella humosa]